MAVTLKTVFPAMLTALLASALLAGCSQSGESSADEASSDSPEAERVEVEVGADGYTPSRVETSVGKPLTLVFNRTSDKGCGDKLVIASRGIEKDLPLNEPVEVSMTPEETGEIRFTCGMDMYDGSIVVQ